MGRRKLTPEGALRLAKDLVSAGAGMDPALEAVIAQDARVAYEYLSSILLPRAIRSPVIEGALATNSDLAYWYATQVLNEPWPEGEPAIAQNAEKALTYFEIVLLPRRLVSSVIEAGIARDPWIARMYAREYKGPWPEVEDLMASDGHRAYWYAREVLFPRGLTSDVIETGIAKDPVLAIFYVKDILWPLGKSSPVIEAAIARDPSLSASYLELCHQHGR